MSQGLVEWTRVKPAWGNVQRSNRHDWGLFRCALVGHFIYAVHGRISKPCLHALDLVNSEWHEIIVSGDLNVRLAGNSLIHVNDKLYSLGALNMRDRRFTQAYCFDLALNEWELIEVKGEIHLLEFHSAAFWEAKGLILLNSRPERTVQYAFYNVTYCVDVESWTTSQLQTKGSAPLNRAFQASYFLDTKRLWFLLGGFLDGGMDEELCILDLSKPAPLWAVTKPFSNGVRLAVSSFARTGEKLLIIGGVREELEPSVVCRYEIRSDNVYHDVVAAGRLPAEQQFKSCCVVQTSEEDLILISGKGPYNARFDTRVFHAKLSGF